MNNNEKQQRELAAMVEEAHLNIIKAIASTYTSEQLQIALDLRKEMEGTMAESLSSMSMPSLKATGLIDPFDTPPWDGDDKANDDNS